MRQLGVLWLIVWGAYLAYFAFITSSNAGDLPLPWWAAAASAIGGLTTGVLLLRGQPFWKWLGLASSIVFLAFIYYVYGTMPGPWLEVVKFYAQAQPSVLFHVVVMPLAVGLLALVAAWHALRYSSRL